MHLSHQPNRLQTSHLRSLYRRPGCVPCQQAAVHAYAHLTQQRSATRGKYQRTYWTSKTSSSVCRDRAKPGQLTSGSSPSLSKPAGEPITAVHTYQRAAVALSVCCLGIQLALAPPSLAVIAASDPDIDTFENVPSQLSSAGEAAVVPLSSIVSGPKKREIEACTRKCLPACVRGGEGAPGLGPISVRKEIVVFKEGFRSRQYCLSECAQVCALSLDKDKATQLAQPAQ